MVRVGFSTAIGRGRHAARIVAKADSFSQSAQLADDNPDKSQQPIQSDVVWPLFAKRACYALRRQSLRTESTDSALSDCSKACSATANKEETPPATIWPLSVRRHIRRLRKAESAGESSVACSRANVNRVPMLAS